jgi:hypothetical protein
MAAATVAMVPGDIGAHMVERRVRRSHNRGRGTGCRPGKWIVSDSEQSHASSLLQPLPERSALLTNGCSRRCGGGAMAIVVAILVWSVFGTGRRKRTDWRVASGALAGADAGASFSLLPLAAGAAQLTGFARVERPHGPR